MKKDIKKIISKTFVFVLLGGFTVLPLETTICILNCSVDENDNHAQILHEKENNHYFDLQSSNHTGKECKDSDNLFFNLDSQKCINNPTINFAAFTFLTDENFLREDKLSLKFIAYHFSPPRDNSNKLYKINSILLI